MPTRRWRACKASCVPRRFHASERRLRTNSSPRCVLDSRTLLRRRPVPPRARHPPSSPSRPPRIVAACVRPQRAPPNVVRILRVPEGQLLDGTGRRQQRQLARDAPTGTAGGFVGNGAPSPESLEGWWLAPPLYILSLAPVRCEIEDLKAPSFPWRFKGLGRGHPLPTFRDCCLVIAIVR